MAKNVEPPKPLVKVPLLRKYGGVPPREKRVGRGFSVGEVKAAGITVREARLIGLYVDERRKSVYEENVAAIKEWVEKVRSGEVEPEPRLPRVEVVKRDLSRPFKGKTRSGRKGRGLLKLKNRYTHHYKWKRKHRERLLKKRHEAKRHKGGD